MFERFFTTKMSEKGKSLQKRFIKMRRKQSAFSRVLGIVGGMIAAAVIVCAVIVTAATDGFNPVKFAEQPEKIAAVNVFNGNTGRRYTINNYEMIHYIAENLNNAAFEPKGLSVGYIGTAFNLEFVGADGKIIDKVIVNSGNTLRKDPFFYTDKNSSLCFDYLFEYEYMLDFTIPKDGPFIAMYTVSPNQTLMPKFIPITDEEYAHCIQDTNIKQTKAAYSGILLYKDAKEYENSELMSLPSQSVVELAKEKAGYTVVAPEDIHDIVKAEFIVSHKENTYTQTITDIEKLSQLEKAFEGAKHEGLSACPFGGRLVLTRADGEVITVYCATDTCNAFILGTNGEYSLKSREALWSLFPECERQWKEWVGFAP